MEGVDELLSLSRVVNFEAAAAAKNADPPAAAFSLQVDPDLLL